RRGPGRRRHRARAARLLRAGAARPRRGRTMIVLNTVERGVYRDSVALMRVSRALAALEGVDNAALMIGSPSNKALLRDAGLLAAAGEGATPNDLVIAIRAADARAADAAAQAAARLL